MKSIQEIKDSLVWYERKGEHSDYAYLVGVIMELCVHLDILQGEIDNLGRILEGVAIGSSSAAKTASCLANGMTSK